MPSSSSSSNVHLMTLPHGRPMSRPTKFVFRIVPSLLRNFNQPPQLPPQQISHLSQTPWPPSIQPKLLLLPKRVASPLKLKLLPHSVPLSQCAPPSRWSPLHPPLLLLLLLLNPLFLPLPLPLYPLRCLKFLRLLLLRSFSPLPHSPRPLPVDAAPILTCPHRPCYCLLPFLSGIDREKALHPLLHNASEEKSQLARKWKAGYCTASKTCRAINEADRCQGYFEAWRHHLRETWRCWSFWVKGTKWKEQSERNRVKKQSEEIEWKEHMPRSHHLKKQSEPAWAKLMSLKSSVGRKKESERNRAKEQGLVLFQPWKGIFLGPGTVQPAPLPVPISRPLVHELSLKPLLSCPPSAPSMAFSLKKAKSLYDYLFNPAVTIVPEQEVDTVSDTPDDPMHDSTTGKAPPTPMEISPTPFSQLVADYVNLASFDDPERLSAPEIQPSDYSTEPLDTPAFDDSMLSHCHDLLHFLHDQLSEYFSSVQDPTLSQNFFPHFYRWPPWPHLCSILSPFSHHWVPRFSVSGLSFRPVCPCRSRWCLEWTPWLVSSSGHLPLSRPSLSRLYSGTSIALFRFAPRSLHPVRSTLLVALLPLYLLLLLWICRSPNFSLFAWHFPLRIPTNLPLLPHYPP